MKILAALILMLVPSFVNAQCLVAAPALGGPGWPDGIPASGVGYIRVCPPESYYSPNAACTAGQYWVPYTHGASPVFTTDTLDTCTGYWISSATDTRNYQTVEVTPASFALAFGFGVTAVLTFWFLPYVGSVAGNVIRKM
ncbi:hypothetical protein [Rheinheimera faecalis]